MLSTLFLTTVSFVGRTYCIGNKVIKLTGCQCGDAGIRTLHVQYRLSLFFKIAGNLFESTETVSQTISSTSPPFTLFIAGYVG